MKLTPERWNARPRSIHPGRARVCRESSRAGVGRLRFGLGLLARVAWKVGVRADYRRLFWESARPLLRRGWIEEVVQLAVVGHHMIGFSRACLSGAAEASFYADPSRSPSAPRERAAVAAM